MIYTVTFNPSLDYIVTVDDLKLGAVNRTSRENINPGGKGINVSLVLRNLGYGSTALGFEAGFTGKEIVRLVNEQEIQSEFIEVEKGLSRLLCRKPYTAISWSICPAGRLKLWWMPRRIF